MLPVSGPLAAVDEGVVRDSPSAPDRRFTLIAVTEEQIDDWELPTRPRQARATPRHTSSVPTAVELDAIPPDRLVALVDEAITDLVDADAWEKEQAVEASERELLGRIVKHRPRRRAK